MAKKSAFPFAFMLMLSLCPLISVEIPRFLAFWPALIGIIFGAWYVFGLKQKLIIPKTYVIGAGCICALILLSTLWSISPENALKDALKVTAILGLSGIFVALCKSVDSDDFRPYFHFIPIGVGLAALLILLELACDMPIYRLVRGISFNENANTAEMNRGIVCVVISYFIALGFLSRFRTKTHYILRITLSIIIGMMLLFSQSQSGQLAFVLGLITFFVFPARYKISYHVLATVIILSIILTPPLAVFLYTSLIMHGQDLPWLQDAYAGNRVEIWHFITKYAMSSPLYGYGIEATRYVDHFEHAQIYHHDDTVLHPHNFAVQIWMEFGAIGALFASFLFYKVFKTLSKTCDNHAQKYLVAALIPILLVASVAYGMWQSWWIGELIILYSISGILINSEASPKNTITPNNNLP
ncbi:MAG: O-antigen ligase family protein [Alphaproteobacteria bacterium]